MAGAPSPARAAQRPCRTRGTSSFRRRPGGGGGECGSYRDEGQGRRPQLCRPPPAGAPRPRARLQAPPPGSGGRTLSGASTSSGRPEGPSPVSAWIPGPPDQRRTRPDPTLTSPPSSFSPARISTSDWRPDFLARAAPPPSRTASPCRPRRRGPTPTRAEPVPGLISWSPGLESHRESSSPRPLHSPPAPVLNLRPLLPQEARHFAT